MKARRAAHRRFCGQEKARGTPRLRALRLSVEPVLVAETGGRTFLRGRGLRRIHTDLLGENVDHRGFEAVEMPVAERDFPKHLNDLLFFLRPEALGDLAREDGFAHGHGGLDH